MTDKDLIEVVVRVASRTLAPLLIAEDRSGAIERAMVAAIHSATRTKRIRDPERWEVLNMPPRSPRRSQ